LGLIAAFRNTKLCAVLALVALVWALAAPHCVEAGTSSIPCAVSVAGTDCCGGSASDAADSDAVCLGSCPCFQILGCSGTPQIEFPGVSSAVPPSVAAAPHSAVKAPPSPVPIPA